MSQATFVPPHNTDSERSVLGACMLDREAIIKVSEILSKNDFYETLHGDIYDAVMDLFQSHKAVDAITVADRLKDKNLLDRIGGMSFLVQLAEECPSSSNVFQYATIVKNKAVLRNLMRAGQEIVDTARKTEKDLPDILEESEKKLFAVTQTFIKNHFVHVKDIINLRYEEFCKMHDTDEKGQLKGISTGFNPLDHYTQGLKPSELIIIAARPAMGKSAFALNLVSHAALKLKKVVGFFSLEMPKEQLVDRLFSSALQVDAQKLSKGLLSDEDFARMGDVMEELADAEIYFDDTGGLSISELKSKARRLQMEKGLDMLVIDYLQLMTGGNPLNRQQEISEISRSLKALARELNIPVIALSQLSRNVEQRPDKRPVMSDLRESGSIEQDADIVIMLYREAYYDPDCEYPKRADVLIRKNRSGPVGTVELILEIEKGRFLVPEHKFDFSDEMAAPAYT